MQAELMGVSHEAYVIDNDMLSAVLRSRVPPDVSDATLALDSIRAETTGEGHFLGQAETYARMKSDFLYPEIADRRSIDEWQQAGAPDLPERARDRARAVLADRRPAHIAEALSRAIIGEFRLRVEPHWPADPGDGKHMRNREA